VWQNKIKILINHDIKGKFCQLFQTQNFSKLPICFPLTHIRPVGKAGLVSVCPPSYHTLPGL